MTPAIAKIVSLAGVASALLAGVYAATLLYWLSDSSEGYGRTWAFLGARIEDVMKIQKLRGGVKNALQRLPDPFGALAEMRGPRGT